MRKRFSYARHESNGSRLNAEAAGNGVRRRHEHADSGCIVVILTFAELNLDIQNIIRILHLREEHSLRRSGSIGYRGVCIVRIVRKIEVFRCSCTEL